MTAACPGPKAGFEPGSPASRVADRTAELPWQLDQKTAARPPARRQRRDSPCATVRVVDPRSAASRACPGAGNHGGLADDSESRMAANLKRASARPVRRCRFCRGRGPFPSESSPDEVEVPVRRVLPCLISQKFPSGPRQPRPPAAGRVGASVVNGG